jgi:nitrite reductase/ring-hydroxylating ferredoxin subunit
VVTERPVMAGRLVMLTDDLIIGRRLRRLAQETGLAVADPGDPGPAPGVAVIDLHHPDALDLVRAWRARWPGTLLAGYLTEPDRERWVAAQRAGCDLVTNRGALVPRLRSRLAESGARADRRFPLFEAADVAGRLGLVFRADHTPAGPVAVYQVAGGLHAIADRCPHAGVALSGGELDAAAVTCPGHGSRFDIRTGERLRGPADQDIAVFPLVRDGGQVCLLLRG